jgi:predicted RND superfamily exporter protein
MLFIPSLIYIRGTATFVKKKTVSKTGVIDRFLKLLSSLVVKHPGKIILISIVLTLAISSGMVLLKIETNQENYFPKHNPVRLASDEINKKFGGSQTISVMISGDIKDPLVMKGIDSLSTGLEHLEGVGQVFSISQAVREMSKAIFVPGDSFYDNIPSTRQGIAQMFELYNMSGNPDDFKQLMNLDYSRAHILIKLSDPENRVINSVKSKIAEFKGVIHAEITIGGYAIIMADFAKSIIKGQISSLLFALVTVVLLLTIIFRSFRGGMIGSIPLAASVLIVFGFMGITGIAIDAATALLSSIMIGVGVDFTIQFLWSFNSMLRKGLSYEKSIQGAMFTIGRSIIINALSVMTGFSVLIFSEFTSIRFFGYLVIISIGSCLIGALVVIPSVIMKYKPLFLEKELNKPKYIKYEKDNDFINVSRAAVTGIGTITGSRADYEQKP